MGADGNDGIVDIFSAHSYYDAAEYSQLAEEDMEGSSTMDQVVKNTQDNMSWLSIWWQQFVDASMLESPESMKMDSVCLRSKSICYCIHSTGRWNLMARSSC
ncbi:Magnesium/proton exchanger [Zea mays]|nr:Magnesium/proton exchanger [Zea mays]